jgi:hypothetical protein
VLKGNVRISEIPDCFHEGAGFLCHAPLIGSSVY